MHLIFFIFLGIVALQFADGIAQYPVLSASLEQANHEMAWLAGKIGVVPAIISVKVVIIAVLVALYLLTSIPLWIWIAGCAYYLYRTGKWLALLTIVKSKFPGQTTTSTINTTSTQ